MKDEEETKEEEEEQNKQKLIEMFRYKYHTIRLLQKLEAENKEFTLKNQTLVARIKEEKDVYNKRIDDLQINIKDMEKQIKEKSI